MINRSEWFFSLFLLILFHRSSILQYLILYLILLLLLLLLIVFLLLESDVYLPVRLLRLNSIIIIIDINNRIIRCPLLLLSSSSLFFSLGLFGGNKTFNNSYTSLYLLHLILIKYGESIVRPVTSNSTQFVVFFYTVSFCSFWLSCSIIVYLFAFFNCACEFVQLDCCCN